MYVHIATMQLMLRTSGNIVLKPFTVYSAEVLQGKFWQIEGLETIDK